MPSWASVSVYDVPALPTASSRAFVACSAAFAAAAVVIATVQFAAPIMRGWWLAAYLFLVGAVSQSFLGPGLGVIARKVGAEGPVAQTTGAQLILWNVGTLIVAVADIATAPNGILFGSFLLLVALASFSVSLRAPRVTALRPSGDASCPLHSSCSFSRAPSWWALHWAMPCPGNDSTDRRGLTSKPRPRSAVRL